MSHITKIHIWNFPKEIQEEIARLVRRYAFYLPNWLHELHVYNDQFSSENAKACIKISHEYQQALLVIKDGFWEQDPYEQEQYLVHELSHIYTTEVHDFVGDIISSCVKDDGLRTVLIEQRRKINERLASTLAWAITIRDKEGKIIPIEFLFHKNRIAQKNECDSKIELADFPDREQQEGIPS